MSKLILALACCSALSLEAAFEPNRILFLTNQGDLDQAITLYEEIYQEKHEHKLDLLQQMALLILDKGSKAKDPETQLSAIFGAGISMNDSAFYILEEGMRSPYPKIQLVSLNFLSASQHDASHPWLIRSLSSPEPLIRLEAAYQLALQKHPSATEQIEALMYKFDPRVHALFPQLYALAGDHASIKILKKLLTNPSIEVRVAALNAVSKSGRDDLLPSIRKLSLQHEPRQQEAAAFALGNFKDATSIPALKNLANSPHGTVKIAALEALAKMSDSDAKGTLGELSQQGSLFAIRSLGAFEGQEDTLAKLSASKDTQIRINATLSLLERKDPRALQGAAEILSRDIRDSAFIETASAGRSLKAWKAIPSASLQEEEEELAHELSLSLREEILTLSAGLPEKEFLQLAHFLIERKQNDLIPQLTELLIALDTPKTVELLKYAQQKTGAPLIRNFANLGLVKLNEEGPYKEVLQGWLMSQIQIDMMKFRTFVPFAKRDALTTFELTPQESARLLVDALEYLSLNQEQAGIELLLKILKEGHPQNRFAAAGLLLRATQ
ncbi:MAG: HEAT repeat domain-containing protein [Parachlamydiaceae bacterium]